MKLKHRGASFPISLNFELFTVPQSLWTLERNQGTYACEEERSCSAVLLSLL